MPLSYSRFFSLCLAFLLLSMLAGCRSERVVFHFGPEAGAHVPLAAEPALPTPSAVDALPAAQSESMVNAQPVLSQAAKLPHQRAVRRVSGGFAAKGTLPRQKEAMRHLLKRHRAPASASVQAPAEQGLGRIFFFALFLVLLVLAGITWGIAALAGISAWKALAFLGLGVLALFLIKAVLELLGNN
ncbi:hypothetical protein GCM10023185_25170 [Hymenobacter saemangeumensis]|uniref:Uncharacterized protein n=1 Tax=Hymenobacter saemangeumensis TaxID=1084522 RepID=A0ABP8IIB9_9BACT